MLFCTRLVIIIGIIGLVNLFDYICNNLNYVIMINKGELMDFCIWIDKNDIVLENGNLSGSVDLYLKSLKSSPQHKPTKVVINKKEKLVCCDNCIHITLVSSRETCLQCYSHSRFKQTD
jgi:hypothetical protein